MKLLFFLMVFAFSTPAFARIGETTQQLRKRYGEPSEKTRNNPEFRSYSFRGYNILVGLGQGVSLCEVYEKDDRSRLSEPEIRGLLQANVGDSPWRDEPEEGMTHYLYWSRNKSRVAIYQLDAHRLLITSKPFLARFTPLLGVENQKKTEGF